MTILLNKSNLVIMLVFSKLKIVFIHFTMKAGIKYAYGLELRPGRNGGHGGFMLPVNQIKPTVEETWEGVRAMCMEIKSEYVSMQSHFDNEIDSDNWDENNIIQVVP